MKIPGMKKMNRLPAAARAVALPPGEKALAGAVTEDGQAVIGTRDALHLALAQGTTRLGWEEIERADWDAETGLLTVVGVGTWGEQKPHFELALPEPGQLLELVRERVTASVVLQRHFRITDTLGGKVIARRAPRGDEPIHWFHEFDAGVDPDDPDVRRLAAQALARAREETGF
ncbi:hypothetical protein [Nocardioides sp. AE5]|uniref:hypothetical protein n=1 Tax=Nocardioides sp. AE5 TaxID=2962573 RepID=UPI002880CDB4|nr:hypothetical protein [Nocardioides sp. AE5]MDT0203308.1 hypothetical protein [Nocardioides sp. AE5]